MWCTCTASSKTNWIHTCHIVTCVRLRAAEYRYTIHLTSRTERVSRVTLAHADFLWWMKFQAATKKKSFQNVCSLALIRLRKYSIFFFFFSSTYQIACINTAVLSVKCHGFRRRRRRRSCKPEVCEILQCTYVSCIFFDPIPFLWMSCWVRHTRNTHTIQ